jgi:hypothetical protein
VTLKCDYCDSEDKRLYYTGMKGVTTCGDCHNKQMERCRFCDHTRSVHDRTSIGWETNDDYSEDYVVDSDMCDANECHCGNFGEPKK